MSRGHIGGREIFVAKQERKTVFVGFCGFILKYWSCQKVYHIKFYYYMPNSESLKMQLIVLFYSLYYPYSTY
jgi:hypothetical protein